VARIKLLIFLFFTASLLQAQKDTPEFDYAGLDSNKIYTSIAEAQASEMPVYRLDLSKKKLKQFPLEILAFTELRELHLSKNKLDSLPAALVTLDQLEILSVAKNKWTAWPEVIFKLQKLKFLDVNSNELEALPDELVELQQLSHLVAWGNPFAYFTPQLTELPRLTFLDLFLVEMDKREQAMIREWLPSCEISMSDPCDCDFSEDE